jgi:hypothetical protein
MSYSFSIKAVSKTQAKEKVAEAFDGVVVGQAIHDVDRDAAVACAEAFIDILGEPSDGDEVRVSVNGYLSWQGDMSNANFTGANVTISASIAKAS